METGDVIMMTTTDDEKRSKMIDPANQGLSGTVAQEREMSLWPDDWRSHIVLRLKQKYTYESFHTAVGQLQCYALVAGVSG